MRTKPKASDIKSWDMLWHSDKVVIYQASVWVEQVSNGYAVVNEKTDRSFDADFYKVMPRAGRTKTFFGETGWFQARAYAVDFDFGAWGAGA